MALVPAKCTQCGSSLEVENSQAAAICSHCGSAFIVEQAINNYNITNNVTNHIHADVVNVVDGNLQDFIRNAKVAYDLDDYGKLELFADKILNLEPNNLEGLFYKFIGLLQSKKSKKADYYVKIINYANALAENNYKTEQIEQKLKPVLMDMFFEDRSDWDDEILEKTYNKLNAICEKLNFDPLSLQVFNILYAESPMLIKYLSTKFNFSTTESVWFYKIKEYYKTMQIMQKTGESAIDKNFICIKRYDNGDKYYMYYKNSIILNFNLEKRDIYFQILDKNTKKLITRVSIYEKTLFNNEYKFAKNTYNLVKSLGYQIEITGDKLEKIQKVFLD